MSSSAIYSQFKGVLVQVTFVKVKQWFRHSEMYNNVLLVYPFWKDSWEDRKCSVKFITASQ